MSLSRRANKPVKCMLDSTVKASDINLGLMVQAIPAGLLLHVVAHRVLGYGADCMNTWVVHKQKQHAGSLEMDQITPDAHISLASGNCTSQHITDE